MKKTHLRVSDWKGNNYSICSRKGIEHNNSVWNKNKVTCKNCLKRASHVSYTQRRTYVVIDEDE